MEYIKTELYRYFDNVNLKQFSQSCTLTGEHADFLKNHTSTDINCVANGARIYIEMIYAADIKRFLIGMEPGFELLLAEVACKVKENHSDMQIFCIQPYEGYYDNLIHDDKSMRKRFQNVEKMVTDILYFRDASYENIDRALGIFLVNYSQIVLSVNYKERGTFKSHWIVKYANKVNCPVIELNPWNGEPSFYLGASDRL